MNLESFLERNTVICISFLFLPEEADSHCQFLFLLCTADGFLSVEGTVGWGQ